jgi:NAD(P)-dependent dehydrogenase (short-subunit alcohol dehydrogenase family)
MDALIEIVGNDQERPIPLLDVHRVIATCRKPDEATGLHRLQEMHGARLSVHRMDITAPESIETCAREVKSNVPYLSLLFNVSGVLHIPGMKQNPDCNVNDHQALHTPQTAFDRSIHSTTGNLVCTRQLIP